MMSAERRGGDEISLSFVRILNVLSLRWLYHTVYRAFPVMMMAFPGMGMGIGYDRSGLSNGDGVNHDNNSSVQCRCHEDLQM